VSCPLAWLRPRRRALGRRPVGATSVASRSPCGQPLWRMGGSTATARNPCNVSTTSTLPNNGIAPAPEMSTCAFCFDSSRVAWRGKPLTRNGEPLAMPYKPLARDGEPLATPYKRLARNCEPLATRYRRLAHACEPLATSYKRLAHNCEPLATRYKPLAHCCKSLTTPYKPLASAYKRLVKPCTSD